MKVEGEKIAKTISPAQVKLNLKRNAAPRCIVGRHLIRRGRKFFKKKPARLLDHVVYRVDHDCGAHYQGQECQPLVDSPGALPTWENCRSLLMYRTVPETALTRQRTEDGVRGRAAREGWYVVSSRLHAPTVKAGGR
jgi:hypothetical protein